MSAPIDMLGELLEAAVALRKAESPESVALAMALFTMKAGAALGCSPAEVKEQIDLMRAPSAEVRMGGGGRLRGTPKQEGAETLDQVVESVASKLKLTPARDVPWATEETP